MLAGVENISTIFTCNICEKVREDGKHELRVIFMDGTATGVLGTLPDLHRPNVVVNPAERTSKSQYLVSNQYVRQFFNYLFKNAGKELSKPAGRGILVLPCFLMSMINC